MSRDLAEVFWIEDDETFAVLGDTTRLELLEVFHHPMSVSEAAEILDVPRTRLYHHVKLLEESGMIAVADTRQAGALTEKLYMVTAKSYRLADSYLATATPREQAHALLSSLFGATQADFVRSVHDGMAVLGEPKEKRKVSASRGFLRLTPDQTVQLIQDLEAVVDRYHDEKEAAEDDSEALRVAVLNVIYPSSRRI